MKVKSIKPTLLVLAGSLIALGLITPVSSYAYAGMSVGYYYGGHYGYSGHHYGGYGRRHGYYGGHRYGYRGYRGYRGYNYRPRHNYGYRSYYSPYKSYQYYPKSNYNSSDASNNYQTDNKYTGTDSTAWNMLSQGQAGSALNIFASEAESNPKAGIPKVGYALATAASGDLSRAVWAMRRAFRIDPDSLHYLLLDEANQGVIDTLIDKYHYSENQEDEFYDEAFMVSALNYLKHDYIASRGAVDHAINNGDRSTSAHNLQKLINQQLGNDKKL